MIECTNFKSINQGNCIGFADIYIDKWGIEIFGISLYQKEGHRWINFPSKMYEKDGEKKWLPYFRFKDRSVYDQFCTAVKKAIDKKAQEMKESSSYDKLNQEDIPF